MIHLLDMQGFETKRRQIFFSLLALILVLIILPAAFIVLLYSTMYSFNDNMKDAITVCGTKRLE